MGYDPFTRGSYPVGARSLRLVDPARGQRGVWTELWYPAAEELRGKDLDPGTRDRYEAMPGMGKASQDALRDAPCRPGAFPLVVFSHGFGSHRRQSTFLCTHLASHGYVVVAPDHQGNTIMDVTQMILRARAAKRTPDAAELLAPMLRDRPADVRFVAARVLAGAAAEVSAVVVEGAYGVMGHSFGGWTALTVAAADERVAAVLALAPGGGASRVPDDPLAGDTDFVWSGRTLPVAFIVAERDSLLPLAGMRELFARVPSPKRMVVIRGADHLHFCDRAQAVHTMLRTMPNNPALPYFRGQLPPFGELCPADNAVLTVRGLGVAHFDAALVGGGEAAALLDGDLVALLAARDVPIDVA